MGVRCTSVITKKHRLRLSNAIEITKRRVVLAVRKRWSNDGKRPPMRKRVLAGGALLPRRAQPATPLFPSPQPSLDASTGSVAVADRTATRALEAIFAPFCSLTFSFVSIDRPLHVYCKYWPFHFIDSTGMILLSPWPLQRDSVFSCSTITPPPPFQLGHVTWVLKFWEIIQISTDNPFWRDERSDWLSTF